MGVEYMNCYICNKTMSDHSYRRICGYCDSNYCYRCLEEYPKIDQYFEMVDEREAGRHRCRTDEEDTAELEESKERCPSCRYGDRITIREIDMTPFEDESSDREEEDSCTIEQYITVEESTGVIPPDESSAVITAGRL
jgi:hypothetical protein